MKNVILSIAVLIMIGQVAGLFFYHMPAQHTPQENQAAPKTQEDPPEQPLYAEETIDYSLQNDEVNITFDKGKSWIPVPIEKEKLFNGEYTGNQEDLIENSYVLTKDHSAFLYSDEISQEENQIKLLYSQDKGQTWQESVIAEQYPPIRFRKVAFLDGQFGYVIVSGDRTMSQEMSSVFLTDDGGKTWKETNNSNVTRLIADGGFVDEQTGFLSFGLLNPEHPELYFTQDAGTTWNEAEIRVPEKYYEIFVIAETPFKEGNQLAVLINQGPNGDYAGGKVKGKFFSEDNGKTWEFSTEVQPNG